MLLVSFCCCLCLIHWSHALRWEWRCSWSIACRRCSNYIWVVNNFIAYYGASYIRDLTVTHALLSKIGTGGVWRSRNTKYQKCILSGIHQGDTPYYKPIAPYQISFWTQPMRDDVLNNIFSQYQEWHPAIPLFSHWSTVFISVSLPSSVRSPP